MSHNNTFVSKLYILIKNNDITFLFKLVLVKFLKETVSNMPNEVKFVEFDVLTKLK